MTYDGIILVIAFFGFTVFFISFTLLIRRFPTYPIHIFFSSLILAFFVSVIFSWIVIPNIFIMVVGVFLYSLFSATYIFGIYLNIDSSLHVRILQEVANAQSKGLTYKELLSRYNKKIILEKRIAWLVNSGEIDRVRNAFYRRRHFSILFFREKFIILLERLYGR